MKRDPTRLSTEGSSLELRTLLRAAHEDVLEPELVEQIRCGLSRAGVLTVVTSRAAGAGSPSVLTKARGSLSAKVIGALAVGTAVCAGIWLAMGNPQASAPKPPPARAVSPISSSAHSLSEPAVAAAPLGSTGENRGNVEAASSARRPNKPRSSIATKLEVTDQTAPSPREGALLLEARKALDADPARALRLVHQHQAEFPTSQLEPERSQIAKQAERRLNEPK